MKVLVACVVLLGASVSASAAPRWCKEYASPDRVDAEQVKQALADYGGRPRDVRFIVKAARMACGTSDDGRDILAAWKKETGLDDASALASLEARVSPKWETDYEALCKALPPTSGDKSDDNARRDARQRFFGCDDSDPEPGWMHRQNVLPDVAALLDRNVLDRDGDEIVRIAWVMGEAARMLDPNESGPVLARYAVAQFDIKALRYDVAMKQLAAAPYRGNRYAITVVAETIAYTKAKVARLEAAVASKTKDRMWKDLLITVPQKAASEWLAAAAKHKDMLTHGGVDGKCDTLRADVVSLMKPLAATIADIQVIANELNENPIAGLMIWRWAHCLGDQGDSDFTKVASAFSQSVPPVPGPRAAAYNAALAAAAALKKQPFDYHDIDEPGPMRWGEMGMSPSSMSRGVVKSVTKKKGTLEVTFAADKYKYMSRACKDTKQIDRIDDGRVIYRQECHDAGMAVGDHAPPPTLLAPECTGGVEKGRFVWLDDSVPWLVFADKSSKKLVAAYCLPLR